MSFSQVAKNELCRLPLQEECCQIAELSGIMKMSGTIHIGSKAGIGFKISTENPAIARRGFTLIKNIFGKHTEIMVKKNNSLKKNNVYILSITPEIGAKDILIKTGIIKESKEGALGFISKISPSILKGQCCKMAYLRGAFLGGGSISNPEKTYHMEFVSSSLEQAEDLMKLINSFSPNAKVIQRKNSFVVYLKEGNQIIDILSVIGAHTALLELENVRIYKEVRNNVNRLVNCETANLNKTVDAAVRQIESIKFIKEKCGLRKLSPSLREVAELRINYPDISLKEMGEMLKPPIGKSGVNHRLRKIEKIAEELRD
ncbi:DNA-binding protein WhiA [Clostridium cylindrosporum]|uniref:Probable cell division protein WhiA n=1 Tax=Clostridium cylindrosporum DSM 605 TaxID=1121307 RepID=A0A0J8D5G9_CLOCY|nr:DNA-binding protein WhiA [Clostridium cylindrosporum]KMT21067.1 putative sporulation transcription regulator WhiA [Clostridium cylindrosporum DSM 605]